MAGFFSTDIEVLPSSRYDAGADRWNEIYRKTKNELIQKFGSAGASPRTGNNMPAVPFAVAVAISVEYAVALSKMIVQFIVQKTDESDALMLIPAIAMGQDGGLMPTHQRLFMLKTENQRERQWLDEFEGGDEGKRRAMAITWLNSPVVKPTFKLAPHNVGNLIIANQRNLDPNWRWSVPGANITTLQLTEESQWLRPAVRAYQDLIWNAFDLFTLSAGGTTKPLTAEGADLFLRRVFASTQWLSIRIPDITLSDVVEYSTKRTTEVLEKAGGAAADAANWATRTATGVVNEAIGGLDIFTWLVLGSVGLAYLAIST